MEFDMSRVWKMFDKLQLIKERQRLIRAGIITPSSRWTRGNSNKDKTNAG